MEKTIFEMHQLSRKNVPTMKKTTLKSVRNRYGKTANLFFFGLLTTYADILGHPKFHPMGNLQKILSSGFP